MDNINRDTRDIQQDIRGTRSEMSETIDAIQARLSPDNLLGQAVKFFNSENGQDMANNLSRTVKNNPVPISLIGLGLTWLMMSDRNKQNQYREPAYPQHAYPRDRYDASAGYRAANTPSYGPDYDPDDDPDRADRPGEQVGERAGAALHEAGQKATAKAADVRDSVTQAATHVGHKINNATDALREQTAHTADQAKRGLQDALREQPLTLVGAGLALGALLGAGLPSTRREDELMGETRDELLDSAKEAGQKQAEKVRKVANAAAEAAVEEADKNGITPEKGKEKMENAIDEAKAGAQKIATAATEAGKQEARKQGLTDTGKSHSDESNADTKKTASSTS